MLTTLVAGRVYDWTYAIGRLNRSEVGFSFQTGVVAGKDCTVYVVNRGSERNSNVPFDGGRVSKWTFSIEPGQEEFLIDMGRSGTQDGQFIWPTGVDLDSQENVYVTDEWLNRVTIYDKDGKLLGVWGTAGDGDGEFNRPSGIAIDQEDNLYIVDSLNHRVQKFTKDGKYLAQWGSFGTNKGQFNSPWGITIDHDGYVYVVDCKNHRLQKFTPDGEYITEYGSFGTGPAELNHPCDVAVDPDGDIYICDWANNRVQLFAPDGRFLTSLLGDAQELSRDAKVEAFSNPDAMKARRKAHSLEPEWRLVMPQGLTFDAENNRLIISDTVRYRMQIYTKVKDYADPQLTI